MRTGRIGVGIAGTGRISDLHAIEYLANPAARIVALCDTDTARAARRAAAWGLDGVAIDASGATEIAADRFFVSLPPLRDARDSFKLIEVEFDSHVVRYGRGSTAGSSTARAAACASR